MINRDTITEIHNYGIDTKNRVIYLNGYKDSDDDDPGVDYRMAVNFIKNIKYLDSLNNNEITINMHSVGGHWGPGMAIFDAISVCSSYVTIVCYGQAESMSSIIFQAADNRVMMRHSYFMCHFGSTDVSGDHLSSQNWVEFDKKNLDLMMNVYSNKCYATGEFFKEKQYSLSKTKAYIKRRLKNGDWYMTSDEAVYYGFADAVL